MQTLLYRLSSSVIMCSFSSPATLYECNWVMGLAGYIKQSCKYPFRLTCIHVAARYWSLMIEALSEESALNIYCSIFGTLRRCVHLLFPLCSYIYTQLFFCPAATSSHGFLLFPKEPLHDWNSSWCKHKPLALCKIQISLAFEELMDTLGMHLKPVHY